MKNGFVSSLDLHNRSHKRWLWIASHALQLSAKDITLWGPLSWVHLVLLGGLTSGTSGRRHKVTSSDGNLDSWTAGKLWKNQKQTDYINSFGKPKQACLKEANIPSHRACSGSEHRAAESLSSSQDTHVPCLHCPAKYLSIFSFPMTMPLWKTSCVCMSTWK